MKKNNNVLKTELSTWQNLATGEIVEANEVLKKAPERNGFMITYLSTIIDLLDIVGNKKLVIVKYILNNMDTHNNTLLTTTRELAKATRVSTPTITETLKILEENEIISRRTGAIMLNPKLVHKGSSGKERALITRFTNFNIETETESEIQ